jgi:hypothetical protein
MAEIGSWESTCPNRSDRPVNCPDLPVFRSCYSPVQRSRLFLRYFNGLSRILRTSAPCKSPVFFIRAFSPADGLTTGAIPIALFHYFSIASHCSCADAFSLGVTRPCIATATIFHCRSPVFFARLGDWLRSQQLARRGG